jgi:opacity protein-like surface antigen
MQKVARSLVVFVFVIAVSVFPFNTASAQIGVYVGVFGGYTFSPDASWEDHVFNYDLDVQETGIFGVKFGGTHPTVKFFSIELEYSYLNPDVDRTVFTTAGSDYYAIEGDVKIHNFMFNTIFKYPEGKIHPYLGLGLGFSYFDFSVTSTSRLNGVSYNARHSHDDTVFAWQVLAGVDIELTNNLSLDIGCRYFDTESLNDSYDDYDDDYYDDYDYDHYDGPTLDYRTFMVTLGLKFRF